MNKQYYQDIVTQKSWEQLIELKNKYKFVLIGGWAVYLYTKNLKSKDIDIIVDYKELGLLRKNFAVYKNDRLKKYEIKIEGIDIDIYLPHFSELGLPVEEVINFTEKTETFLLLKKEILLITKVKAFLSRRSSIKGQKDKIDILALIMLPDFDFQLFSDYMQKFKLEQYKEILKEILNQTKQLPELNLNKHYFSREKKRILDLLD